MQKLLLARHALRHLHRHHGVDEGHGLAAVVQQPGLGVARGAFAGIRFAAEQRVAAHHVAAVDLVLGHVVRPAAHRPAPLRQPLPAHAGLGVERIGLPRHRRGEGERQPPVPLRCAAFDGEPQRVPVQRLCAGQRPAAQVEKGPVHRAGGQPGHQLRVLGLQQRRVVLQAQQQVTEHRLRRRLQPRVRVALEGVDEVFGRHLARAGGAEVPGRELVLHLLTRQLVEAQPPRFVHRKRRVRRPAHAGPDGDVVHAERHPLGRRVGRQRLAGGVQEARRHHRGRGARHQLVRPLQVVHLVQRLVDGVGVRVLVGGVRRGRVQVARAALVERHVQRVLRRGAGGPGVVAAGGQGQCQQRRTPPPHLMPRRRPPARPPCGRWPGPARVRRCR